EMHAALLETDCNKERFILPIMQGEKMLGVLSLYKNQGQVADLDDLVFMTTVTNTLASIISNKRDGEAIKTQANVIDNIHDAVVSVDMDGIVTSWNKGAERLFDHLAVDILGQNIAKVYPEYSLDDIQDTITALRTSGMHESEVTLPRNRGEYFDAHLSLSLLKDEVGNEIGITGYCLDISDRKYAERELSQHVKQQSGIAELGQIVLMDISLNELLDRSIGLIAGIMQADFGAILELISDGNTLVFKAGEGWRDNLVDVAYIDVEENTQAGYTLLNREPIIVSDLIDESRFNGPQLLYDNGVTSGMSVIINGNSQPYGVLCVHTKERREFTKVDITFLRTAANILAEAIERKKIEESIIQSEARFRNLVEASNDWVWEVNEHVVYTYASPQIEDILGYRAEEIIGKTPFDFMAPDEAERVALAFKSIAKERASVVSMEKINLHKDGHMVVLESSGVPIYDKDGNFRGYRGIDRDITDRKKDEQNLEQMAHYDYLTGLPNRALFFDRLRQSLARAPWHNRMIAVLFLDLDRFKIINDTLGHDTGDQLLSEVATRLSGFVRAGDTVARLGGDEFAIILDDIAESSDILMIAQSIHAALEKPIIVKARELFITTSIGISRYPNDGDDSKLLVTRADIAMYHAKAQGRNNCQFYSANMDSVAEDRLGMETRLRHALDAGEYILHYQPKMDLESGRICGMEALIRWMEPGKGLMPPYKFIPLLEDTGLIVSVGEWILSTACRETKYWQQAGFSELVVSVNLSARQFIDDGLEEMIYRVLQESELDARYLELEITESILMDDADKTIDILRNLHDKDIKIVIDDFGTGYSSLSYLKKFPISTLKIDRSFIMGVTDNEEDASLTQAIIAMAHGLGIRVVAEGAEKEEQLAFLKEKKCDEVQGYHYSRPLGKDELSQFLADNYFPKLQQNTYASISDNESRNTV
ncbi:MAG: EAL domain-containing protein, partial [Gammaproteobacteria bacterium]|nr:EAL domain-containing protein [Gammaproteobacteria bacterium]